ncbi:MAG: methyl-accepting chemotaxis protein [Oligoflexus sp.]
MKLQNLSFKAKLIFLILMVCTTLGGAASVLYLQMTNNMENARLRNFENYATILSRTISAQFFERYGDVQVLAENPALKTMDIDKIPEVLNKVASIYGIYDLLLVVDTKGKLVASNTRGPQGETLNLDTIYRRNYSNDEWFRRVMAGQFTADASRGFNNTYVEDARIDTIVSSVYGEQRLGNSFSAEIRDHNNNVIGVVSVRAGFRWVEQEFISYYRLLRAQGMATTELAMLNKDGFLIVDYDPSSRGGSLDMIRDFNSTILKTNLVEAGVEAAKLAAEGKAGAIFALHVRKNVIQASGYTPINDEKFIPELGWTILVRTAASNVMSDLNNAKTVFFSIFLGLVLVSCTLAFLFASNIATKLMKLAEKLGDSSGQVASASSQIANSATELSEAATEQASSLQETVSSIDEINAMVNKNAESARRSNEKSEESERASNKGKQAITEMMGAIDEISSSNEDIMNEMGRSNQEISEIVKVIEEIGSRTKVINDIVFQTKLLSFNASVEAARAGEHGKGFAVVAEEVGNLAQMSGNAAKEISMMLTESIDKVRSIVANTKEKVDVLVSKGKIKVEAGTKIAQECGIALDEILSNVSEVNQMVKEIAVASNEQSQGIQEVTRAMSQLDQVTQQNAAVAHQSSAASEQLKSESSNLKHLVDELLDTIGSQSKASKAEDVKSKPEKSKVVHMDFTEKKPPKENLQTHTQMKQVKKVVGGEDLEVPLADDPRFEP